jgi:hypothetical protein
LAIAWPPFHPLRLTLIVADGVPLSRTFCQTPEIHIEIFMAFPEER